MCVCVCVWGLAIEGHAGGFAALVAAPLEAEEEGQRAHRRCGREGRQGRAAGKGPAAALLSPCPG